MRRANKVIFDKNSSAVIIAGKIYFSYFLLPSMDVEGDCEAGIDLTRLFFSLYYLEFTESCNLVHVICIFEHLDRYVGYLHSRENTIYIVFFVYFLS